MQRWCGVVGRQSNLDSAICLMIENAPASRIRSFHAIYDERYGLICTSAANRRIQPDFPPMTPDDLSRIEQSLQVTLPSDYRHLLLNYPVVFQRGMHVGDIWDDADAVIRRNQELRAPRKSLGQHYAPLPPEYLFIGDDGAGWQHLIDLQTDPSIVHIMKYEAVDSIAPATNQEGAPQAIGDWLHDRLLEARDGGVDISSPDEPANLSLGCVAVVMAVCLMVAVAVVLMTLGVQSLQGK